MHPVDTTGPGCLKRFLNTKPEYNSMVDLKPSCTFYSMTNKASNHSLVVKDDLGIDRTIQYVSKDCKCSDGSDIYAVHLWDNNWVERFFQDPRWLNKRYWRYFIFFMIGCILLVLILLFH